MDQGEQQAQAFQELARRRKQWLAALGIFVVDAMVNGSAFPRTPRIGHVIEPALTIAVGVTFLLVTARTTRFRCPRCSKLFVWRMGAVNLFAKTCRYCGLAGRARW